MDLYVYLPTFILLTDRPVYPNAGLTGLCIPGNGTDNTTLFQGGVWGDLSKDTREGEFGVQSENKTKLSKWEATKSPKCGLQRTQESVFCGCSREHHGAWAKHHSPEEPRRLLPGSIYVHHVFHYSNYAGPRESLWCRPGEIGCFLPSVRNEKITEKTHDSHAPLPNSHPTHKWNADASAERTHK